MAYFKAEVKKYNKKYKKKSKTGKIKEASTIQYSIQLQKDNPFKEEDFIYILTETELNELLNQSETNESSSNEVYSENQDLKKSLELMQGQLNRKEGDLNHIQKAYNKVQEDLNKSINDLNQYAEIKGALKTLKVNMEGKNRFAKWIAGIDNDIQILDDNLKLLTGEVMDDAG